MTPNWRKRGYVMQTHLQSMIESCTNVIVGYGLAVVVQVIVFPIYGWGPSIGQNIQIGIIFTGVSLVRSYALRRCFNWLNTHGRR